MENKKEKSHSCKSCKNCNCANSSFVNEKELVLSKSYLDSIKKIDTNTEINKNSNQFKQLENVNLY
jgi:hypothetical protein